MAKTYYNKMNLIDVYLQGNGLSFIPGTIKREQDIAGFLLGESFIVAFTVVHISIHWQNTSVRRARCILK